VDYVARIARILILTENQKYFRNSFDKADAMNAFKVNF